MKIRNRTGPRTLPWGTPALKERGDERIPDLILNLCKILGITKLNTPTYSVMTVERFNRMLKILLLKHAARFRNQWDMYLLGILWSY